MTLVCPHCGQALDFTGKRPAFCAYCGKSLPPPDPERTAEFDPDATRAAGAPASREEEAPSAVGGYRLLRKIGEGGMGRVYEAEEVAGGRRVALKLIAGGFADAADAVERFRREGRLASAVAHPRCVFVLAADEEAGRPYIVMELMPGATLQDLVDREGPLPPEQALNKILDVIEGLQEAHRLGVLHRDVKPSNCFVEADGRVKIGDFGLSKSLVPVGRLTRTGSFIGTPLFASPEQIKGGAVGPASDVYSVAATLYCLLTGRAPHQGTGPSADMAATLARIVSEPVPPMRSLRPGLPPALDKAVLRGLERDPARRYADLEEFRTALLPFLPGRLSIGGLGLRFGAFLVDYLLLMLLGAVLALLTVPFGGVADLTRRSQSLPWQLLQTALGLAMWLLYFSIPETIWGCTLGKLFLRLRVRTVVDGEPPAWGRALLRVAVFYLLVNLGALGLLGEMLAGFIEPAFDDPARQLGQTFVILTTLYPLTAVGIILLLCTMRTRNGYRGLHEVLSGTRVIHLPEAEARRPLRVAGDGLTVTHPESLPSRVGAFEIRGLLRDDGESRVLVGEDHALARPVWIWERPADDPPLTPARRQLSRTTRLRWLAGGQDDGRQWDAFLAPAGAPLPEVVRAHGRLSWAEARHLLTQLADELAAAEAEDALPASLTLAQVWVQADGRVQLVDMPTSAPAAARAPLLVFLRDAAALALEGEPREAETDVADIRAPLPAYASRLLRRLTGEGKPYPDVRTFQAALAATAEKPSATTRSRRLAHLATLTLFLSFGLCAGVLPAGFLSAMGGVLLSSDLARLQRLSSDLRLVAAQDAVAALDPNPFGRAAALQQVEDDLALQARLEEIQATIRAERDLRRPSLTWFVRWYAEAVEEQTAEIEAKTRARHPVPYSPATIRRDARREADSDGGLEFRKEQPHVLAVVATILLLFWPVVWVGWAFACRGGLSFPMMGLALVRRNGRPALRVQCAWRALLGWLPVFGLLTASIWLDYAYGMNEASSAPAWMPLLSSLTWWVGMGLLPLYAFLAVWSPPRSPHDWLAGTYVVPR